MRGIAVRKMWLVCMSPVDQARSCRCMCIFILTYMYGFTLSDAVMNADVSLRCLLSLKRGLIYVPVSVGLVN